MAKIPANKFYTISRESVPTDAPAGMTATHFPVSHNYVLEYVETALETAGYTVIDARYFLSHGSDRFMAELLVEGQRYIGPSVREGDRKQQFVVGLLNSHDQSMAARILGGFTVGRFYGLLRGGVTYFMGESIARKHTRFIERDYPAKVGKAVSLVLEATRSIEVRMDAYRNHYFAAIAGVHDAAVRLTKAAAFPPSAILKVLDLFKEISTKYYDENGFLGDRDAHFRAYELFEAVVSHQNKDSNPFTLPERSEAMFGVLDYLTGYDVMVARRALDVLAK
jgi:hypothetical protein